MIDGWLSERDIHRRRGVEVRSGYAACAMAAHGAGVAFVDDLSAGAFRPERLSLVALPKAPRFPILRVSNIHRPLSTLGESFMTLVSEELAAIQRTSIGQTAPGS